MDILIINPGSVEKKFQTEHLGIAGLSYREMGAGSCPSVSS